MSICIFLKKLRNVITVSWAANLKCSLSPERLDKAFRYGCQMAPSLDRTMERYIVDLEERLGYQHVYTPVLANVELYKTCGHWEHYSEDMFPKMIMDNEELVLRPMNCPHHMMVYQERHALATVICLSVLLS